MNYKFLLCIIAVLCCIVPVMAGVQWTDMNGNPITTAYVGDTVKFSFDTVTNSTTPPGYSDEQIVVWFQKTDPYTGYITDLSGYDKYPAYQLQEYGATSGVTIPSYTGNLQNNTRWLGWVNYTITDEYTTSYTGRLVSISNANPAWMNYYGNATLTVSKNPFRLTNFADWIKSIGGDGFAYICALIIIIVMMIIPYLVLHTINFYIEVIMIVLGVGISFAIGLIALWIVAALAIGCLAMFILVSRTGGQNG